MGENKKKRGVKVGWVFFVILYLVFNAISRIIVSMDFVNPEGFLVVGIESQGKTYNETENQDEYFYLSYFLHSSGN
jgi:hypothetical protein